MKGRRTYVYVYNPKGVGISIRRYIDNVVKCLDETRFKVVITSTLDNVPYDVDILWDPRAGQGPPPIAWAISRKPLIVTFHGAVGVCRELTLVERFGSSPKRYIKLLEALSRKAVWCMLAPRISGIISVSDYATFEAREYLRQTAPIWRIYHGVDGEKFSGTKRPSPHEYLLHVSSAHPKKNIQTLLEAFEISGLGEHIELRLVTPGLRLADLPKGVVIQNEPLSHDELADLYAKCCGFVFPSLHETFGLPIIEAMASGCPVITANTTGCAEIGGENAIMVDPRSKLQISRAMVDILTRSKSDYAKQLSEAKEYASQFSWYVSAQQHMEAFEAIVTHTA